MADQFAEYPSAAQPVALVASVLSVLSALYTTYLYYNIPSLRTFPARLNCSLSFIDLLWFGGALLSMVITFADKHQQACFALGPFYHAASLASMGWLVLLATNVALMIRQQPLAELEAFHNRARMVVAFFACIAPIVLAGNDIGMYRLLSDGEKYYEPTPYGICFISTRLAGARLVLQTGPAVAIFVYALAVFVSSARSVPSFVSPSQVRSVQRRIVSRAIAYMVGFALCWTLAFAEDVSLLALPPSPPSAQPPAVASSLVLAKAALFFALGLWNGVVYIINKWPRLRPELPRLCGGRVLIFFLGLCCPASVVDDEEYAASKSRIRFSEHGGGQGGYGALVSDSAGYGGERRGSGAATAVLSPDRPHYAGGYAAVDRVLDGGERPALPRDDSLYDAQFVTSASPIAQRSSDPSAVFSTPPGRITRHGTKPEASTATPERARPADQHSAPAAPRPPPSLPASGTPTQHPSSPPDLMRRALSSASPSSQSGSYQQLGHAPAHADAGAEARRLSPRPYATSGSTASTLFGEPSPALLPAAAPSHEDPAPSRREAAATTPPSPALTGPRDRQHTDDTLLSDLREGDDEGSHDDPLDDDLLLSE